MTNSVESDWSTMARMDSAEINVVIRVYHPWRKTSGSLERKNNQESLSNQNSRGTARAPNYQKMWSRLMVTVTSSQDLHTLIQRGF